MNLKKKITLSLYQQHKRNQARLHELTYLFWECTLRCNLNCLHCGSDCTREATTPDMPLADFLKVLDTIAPHVNPHKTMIALTGGELLLKLSPEEFTRMLNFIKQTRREGIIRASYGCEGFLGDYEMEVRDTPFFCQAGIHIGSVLADGSISACPSLRSDYIQGNIYEDDFRTVWNERYQIMRDRSWTKTGKCATCKSYKYCQGNGLHLREQQNDKLLCCHLELIQS